MGESFESETQIRMIIQELSGPAMQQALNCIEKVGRMNQCFEDHVGHITQYHKNLEQINLASQMKFNQMEGFSQRLARMEADYQFRDLDQTQNIYNLRQQVDYLSDTFNKRANQTDQLIVQSKKLYNEQNLNSQKINQIKSELQVRVSESMHEFQTEQINLSNSIQRLNNDVAYLTQYNNEHISFYDSLSVEVQSLRLLNDTVKSNVSYLQDDFDAKMNMNEFLDFRRQVVVYHYTKYRDEKQKDIDLMKSKLKGVRNDLQQIDANSQSEIKRLEHQLSNSNLEIGVSRLTLDNLNHDMLNYSQNLIQREDSLKQKFKELIELSIKSMVQNNISTFINETLSSSDILNKLMGEVFQQEKATIMSPIQQQIDLIQIQCEQMRQGSQADKIQLLLIAKTQSTMQNLVQKQDKIQNRLIQNFDRIEIKQTQQIKEFFFQKDIKQQSEVENKQSQLEIINSSQNDKKESPYVQINQPQHDEIIQSPQIVKYQPAIFQAQTDKDSNIQDGFDNNLDDFKISMNDYEQQSEELRQQIQRIQVSIEKQNIQSEKFYAQIIKLKSDHVNHQDYVCAQINQDNETKQKSHRYVTKSIQMLKEKILIILSLLLQNEYAFNKQQDNQVFISDERNLFEFLPNQIDQITHVTFRSQRISKQELLAIALNDMVLFLPEGIASKQKLFKVDAGYSTEDKKTSKSSNTDNIPKLKQSKNYNFQIELDHAQMKNMNARARVQSVAPAKRQVGKFVDDRKNFTVRKFVKQEATRDRDQSLRDQSLLDYSLEVVPLQGQNTTLPTQSSPQKNLYDLLFQNKK